jgi:hypothetical protein
MECLVQHNVNILPWHTVLPDLSSLGRIWNDILKARVHDTFSGITLIRHAPSQNIEKPINSKSLEARKPTSLNRIANI